MTGRHTLAGALALAWVAGTAVGDGPGCEWDRFPPSWREGPLTVWAVWNFSSSTPRIPDTLWWFGDGTHLLNGVEVRVDLDPMMEYDDANNRFYNNSDGAQDMRFRVANWETPFNEKDIRMQVSFGGPEGLSPSIYQIEGYQGGETHYGASVDRRVWQTDGYLYEDWHMSPNPFWEEITLAVPGRCWVGSVIIDTRCYPAPGTAVFALCAMGAVAARRRRS
jgi:hypothetical protein